jgi:hypothetical protein
MNDPSSHLDVSILLMEELSYPTCESFRFILLGLKEDLT